MSMLATLNWPLMLMWAALLACAIHCQRTVRLPNWMTMSLILCGLALGCSRDWKGHERPQAVPIGFVLMMGAVASV